jgi:ribosomal protein S12 methylthiotransferase
VSCSRPHSPTVEIKCFPYKFCVDAVHKTDIKIITINFLSAHYSFEHNQTKIGKTYKVLIDRKEGAYFIGRTEFDSPEVDNEVIIPATKNYLRMGDFANIKITSATEFDLEGEVVI